MERLDARGGVPRVTLALLAAAVLSVGATAFASERDGAPRCRDGRLTPRCGAQRPKSGARAATRRRPAVQDGAPEIALDQHGIVVHAPGGMEWRIGGRLHEDFGAFGWMPRPPGLRPVDDAATRRAFIESYLKLGEDWQVAFQYDFASATQPIQDAAIAFAGIPWLLVSIGNIKEPLGLDQITSDNDTLFTERALPTALTPGRNFGGSAGLSGERWSLVGGLWGNDGNLGVGINGVGVTARATMAPILEPREVLHLGVAGSYRIPNPDATATSFASTPEDYLVPDADRLLDTRTIAGASAVSRLGLEAAYRLGPVLVQGEYTALTVERRAEPALAFSGGYAQAAWVLNGEAPDYRVRPGYGASYAVFEGVKVHDAQRVSNGGPGVFELAARISSLDLDAEGVRGGRERDASVGINWYPERNLKLMADYIDVHAEPRAGLGRRPVDADAFVGRLQLYW